MGREDGKGGREVRGREEGVVGWRDDGGNKRREKEKNEI